MTNIFFTTMVTAAHSNNSRNQLTCIENDKQKNNNKTRQHEKNKPIFQFLLSFFLVQPLFCSNNNHCNCHCRPSQWLPATHAASPFTPPSPLPHQLSSSLWWLKLLSAYAMLLPPMHHCFRHHHHNAAAFPKALLLQLKSCFCQASASAAKRAAAIVLPPPPPLPTRGNRRATTAYKIN